jgi:hypothetical protein
MAAWLKPERRRTPRVAERVSLSVSDASTVLQAQTMNLSAAGVYCVLERFIAPMTKLELDLELPCRAGLARVRCCGVVVRVEPVIPHLDQPRYQTAILFTELAKRDRTDISSFVRERLASSSPSRSRTP